MATPAAGRAIICAVARTGTRLEKKSDSSFTQRLRTINVLNLLLGAVVFALALGLGVGVVVVVVFGAAFGAAYKAVERAFGSRIEERFARQPELRLAISRDGELVDNAAAGLQPWPFDVDQVVANQVARIREEGDAYDLMVRRPAMSLLRGVDPFARQPRTEDYDAALEEFRERLAEHEQALREWLVSYRELGSARSQTFELKLFVTNGEGAAYAEDVRLAIDLPDGVEMVEGWPTVSPPPQAPAYIAPKPRSLHDLAMPLYSGITPRSFSVPSFPEISVWQRRSDGRRIGLDLGNVHHDATVEVPDSLLLRVPGEGRHFLRWTFLTKNGRRHCAGALELDVPSTPGRRSLTRLHGIESFPDVPFVDEEGEVLRDARTSDPPTTPPDRPHGGDALDWLIEGHAYDEWTELGLVEEGRDFND
jgi:hypothetical protein